MSKYVYDFAEGNKDMKALLGGKGATLAEMTNMGLTVPPGFTITAEACLVFLKQDGAPPEMLEEAGEHLERLQQAMGRELGDPDDPLLVSVRSGAKFSMPGMMDTVLNLGLNDRSVEGLAKQSEGDVRFARDAYRRFIQMFGKIVMDVPGEAFEEALDRAKEQKGSDAQDTDLDADDLSALIEEFRGIYREHVGEDFPTGVAFTRDPSTGEKVPYGDYLPNAQGEDVVAGIRNTLPLGQLEQRDAKSYGELRRAMDTLEQHYRDMCDIEFTIEKRKLWILQVRVGKRTAFAEWVMAHDMLEEG